MLQKVKWGEYRIDQLFQPITVKRKLKIEDISIQGIFPAYSANSENSGIVGYYDKPEFECCTDNPIYVIFGDHTRTMSIAKKSFSVLDNVKVLKPAVSNVNVLLFIFSIWRKQIPNLGYKRHWGIAKKCVLSLPVKNCKLDIEFMDSFIKIIQENQVKKLDILLSQYNINTGVLNDKELAVLRKFESFEDIKWKDYKIGNLFERLSTIKLPYKAEDLPKHAVDEYVLPCLTSSFQNQGLNYYAPKTGATVLKGVISIPSNSDVYRAYYQSREFTVLSDAYAIQWKLRTKELTPNQYLFMVMCINKVTNLPIYSYKNKLGGWNTVKEKYIKLPVKDNQIDFDLMENLISALKKVLIKDVVLYVEEYCKNNQ